MAKKLMIILGSFILVLLIGLVFYFFTMQNNNEFRNNNRNNVSFGNNNRIDTLIKLPEAARIDCANRGGEIRAKELENGKQEFCWIGE